MFSESDLRMAAEIGREEVRDDADVDCLRAEVCELRRDLGDVARAVIELSRRIDQLVKSPRQD
jgi:hypothetical protein